jgi:hypothetical protein
MSTQEMDMSKKSKKSPVKPTEKVVARPHKTIEVPIHYEKSNLFRVIHADGVVGNILPSGRAMNLAFYSERLPFPKTDIYDVGPDGKMLRPREGAGERKMGFYREIEMSAVMDWETAKSLSDWLNEVWPFLKSFSEQTRQRHVGTDVTAASSDDVESRGNSPANAGGKTNAKHRSRGK